MTGAMSIKREINLNTIVIVTGFLGTFATVITSWNNLSAQQHDFAQFILDQKATNASFEERFKAGGERFNGLEAMKFQVAQLTDNAKGVDERISRVTENYSNQFADIRNQLGMITTQNALMKQSLDRIEAWNNKRNSGGPN